MPKSFNVKVCPFHWRASLAIVEAAISDRHATPPQSLDRHGRPIQGPHPTCYPRLAFMLPYGVTSSPQFLLVARGSHLKSRCGKEKRAFRVVSWCRAGTAAYPPAAGTLRNRPDVCSRPAAEIQRLVK